MMMLIDEPTYYDLLELAPDASPQEVREAYVRSKAAYKKNSLALYTLMSEEETEELLRRIEEAYHVLSSPEKRRDYDRNHGLLTIDEAALSRSRPAHNQKIVSIDRVPPMELVDGDSDLLVAPTTDFPDLPTTQSPAHTAIAEAPAPTFRHSNTASFTNPDERPASFSKPVIDAPIQGISQPMSSSFVTARRMADRVTDQAIQGEIELETEWKGPFLRRVRESRRIPIEELSDYTKISKTYLTAIEEENYAKLPAPVYLRGFVIQVAKFLKLPYDKVAISYMARFNLARAEKK